MRSKKAWFFIIISFELAVIIPLGISLFPAKPRMRHIAVNARKFGYTPSRIIVNKGDTVVLRPASLDVTHGFLLDGYPIELILKKGIAFRRFRSKEEKVNLKTEWQRISRVKFVASRPGKFTFRCTQICGNLHPFMTGELIVRPNTAYHFFVSMSVWVALAVFLLRFNQNRPDLGRAGRINLTDRFPKIKWLLKRRSFQFMVIFPNLVFFYLFIISSLWGSPVGNRNIAIVFVWILWWFMLKAIFVPLGGRLWCLMCPLPAPAEWLSRRSLAAVKYLHKPFKTLHHRFTGLQKDWPRRLRNIWLQNILFLALISFGMILITRPIATAFMFLFILLLTLGLSLIYRQRVFCLYLCPVGGFLGTYSMASVTEIRAVDPQICKKHRQKECLAGGPGGWACPWNQYVGNMQRNNYCGFCTECIKSCPKDNVGVFKRPFGSDRILKGYDELANVAIMLVVAIAFSISMLGPWWGIKAAANVTESKQVIPFLLYLSAIWGVALVIFPGLLIGIGKASNRLAGRPFEDRGMTLRLAYVFVPIGIFAWIAFSLPPLLVNYSYILSVISDPLGLGWDLLGTADFHFKPFFPHWIPILQGLVLLSGLYFALSRGFLAVKDVLPGNRFQSRVMLLPALFALLVVNLLLKLYMG